MNSAFLRILFVGLLLATQQAAIMHAVWHARHDGARAQEIQKTKSGAAGQTAPESRLCVFDLAFGHVLGCTPGFAYSFSGLQLETEHAARAPAWVSASSQVPFLSRAPPVLL
jgi:hypothetical protein